MDIGSSGFVVILFMLMTALVAFTFSFVFSKNIGYGEQR
jgi:hypothetical protein